MARSFPRVTAKSRSVSPALATIDAWIKNKMSQFN